MDASDKFVANPYSEKIIKILIAMSRTININSVLMVFKINLLVFSQSQIFIKFGTVFSSISRHDFKEFEALALSAYIVS